MEFTINCTRVPIPQGTTLYGIPVEVGPAPAIPGPAPDHDPLPSESNEGVALNPSGRASPDSDESVPTTLTTNTTTNTKKYFVRCRKNTILSSLNVRTLGPLGRLEGLTNCAKTH